MNQYNNALYASQDPDCEVVRFLQESSNRNNSSSSNSTKFDDANVLRNTFIIYGSVWIAILLIFCWVRRRWSKPYTIRNWAEEHKTPLAKQQYGYFSWMRKVFQVEDEKFMLECSMDSICLARIMAMGYKIAFVCALNAIWLFPLYATSPTLKEEPVTDRVAQLTISNVPEGSLRMIGTVIASYIVFGFIMYTIYKELDWFLIMRHKFLTLPIVRNYSVFVRNVPDKMCDNTGVKMFFKECFTDENVVNEAFLQVATPELSQWVKIRTQIQHKLEHAIALQETKGITPRHKTKMFGGQKVDSISTYCHELQVLNHKISKRIADLEQEQVRLRHEREQGEDTLGLNHGLDHVSTNNNNILTRTAQGARAVAKTTTNVASSAVHTAGALFTSGQDGMVHSSGFLTFHTLRARQAAMQIIHHSRPFTLEVTEAPDPDDVIWRNVGRKHKDLQLGKLFSLSATAVVCLLWTIPISFFASLSSVGALREKVAFIDKMLDVAPFLEPVLEILAPFLVVVVNGLLPAILRFFTLMEGKVANAFVAASLFTKLAYFMIIQTFFVSAISGGILQKLSEMVDDPTSIISLLATSLPTQSTYFIQILIVYTTVTVGLEVLGIPRIIFAYLRRFIGPKLTEKERKRPVLFLRPLDNPGPFNHAAITAQMILYMTVLFVYAPIAPLSSIILVFMFWYLEAIYRHQFIYIYPKSSDSGGLIWMNFIRLMFVCMLIAEFTIVGLMALKKGAVSVPLMIPLIIITILFNAYIRQQHFKVMAYLPSHECLQVDKSRGMGYNLDFLDGAFVQPEMQEKYVYPENLSRERQVAWGLRSDEEAAAEPAVESTSNSSHSGLDGDNAAENTALQRDGRTTTDTHGHGHRSRSGSRKRSTYGTN